MRTAFNNIKTKLEEAEQIKSSNAIIPKDVALNRFKAAYIKYLVDTKKGYKVTASLFRGQALVWGEMYLQAGATSDQFVILKHQIEQDVKKLKI